MRFQHVIEAVYHRPWLITSGGHATVRRLIESKLAQDDATMEISIENPRQSYQLDDNGIAHIHICGVIGHRLGSLEKSCGNTCVCEVRKELDACQQDGANGIFLCIDSPGGTVTGVPELADALSEIAQSIPIYAYTDSLMASAGYWLAASASKIWASPSADIGSIGVLFPWIDKSAAWQQIGIRFEPITNEEGVFKSAGHGPSLSEDQKNEIQRQIQDIYDMFKTSVVTGREKAGSGIYEDAMRGQCLMGEEALCYGMIDALGTREQAYAMLCHEAGVFPINIPICQTIPILFSNAMKPGIKKEDSN